MFGKKDDDKGGIDWDAALEQLTAEDQAATVTTDEDELAVPVDSPEALKDPVSVTKGRRDIIPPVFKSKQALLGEVKRVVNLGLHTTGYHAIRAPFYGVKIAARAPVGAWRWSSQFSNWVWDAEGKPVRDAVVNKTARTDDPTLVGEYLKLCRERDRRVRWRGFVAAFAITGTVIGAAALYALGGPLLWTVLAATTLACGVKGRKLDKPLVSPAVVKASLRPLTSEHVVEALRSIDLPGINRALAKDPNAITFPAPIVRDGPGWRAEVELPPGVTVGEVADKREKLASGLGRPLGCVWPEGNAEIHPGRLVIWVGDKSMNEAKQKAWPLAKSGRVDVFTPWQFGTDQRGDAVRITLAYASIVVGSIPRMGKTFAARLILLAAALDPRVRLYAFDLKGTGDLGPLEPVCHAYRAGDEDEDIEYALASLREIQAEMRRRAKVIRELPRDLCPESKVTTELADSKSLGLQPIVLGIDECQMWFEHPEHGKEFEDICTDLVKRGPALAIIPLFATQRPDSKSLPKGISDNAVLRFCLKVMGDKANNMVLGSGMYAAGIRATMFSRRDRGIGYLAGEGDEPSILRSHFVDAPGAERIVARARAMREKLGNITGHAAGHTIDADTGPAVDLLADIAAVVGDEKKVWNSVIVNRLAQLRPDTYGHLDGLDDKEKTAQLTSMLKPFGVKTGQVWGTDPATGEGGNRKGVTVADVRKMLTQRDEKRGGG